MFPNLTCLCFVNVQSATFVFDFRLITESPFLSGASAQCSPHDPFLPLTALHDMEEELVAPDEAEDEEAQEDGGAVTEHQPRAKRQRGDRCELLTRKVTEMEKKVSLEQEKVRLTEKKRSPVKRERQALEKSRMKIDQMERALVDLRGELQAARQLAADKVAADKKRSEKAAKKEEETRSMTEAGAIQLVTICLKYHSRFDNRISTHIHDEFTRLVEDGDLQQMDGRSAQALEKRFNIELSAFRLWASAANRAVALSGVPADGVEEKVRAHWRPTTGLFHKSFYAQMPHNPLGDEEDYMYHYT